jgi:transposase InsO family protein
MAISRHRENALAAVVDWFSRRVLSWRLSITMDVDFCLEAVEEALAGDIQDDRGMMHLGLSY